MKVAIYYFSGTGNTKKIVDEYASVLGQEGVEVELCNIERTKGDVWTYGFDMVGIAYPIYGFNAPNIVLDFAERLVKQDKPVRTFVLKTSGEPLSLNNASSIKLKKILKKRNFHLTNEYHYIMPYNIIFRHTDVMASKMWEAARSVIPVDCRELLRGEGAQKKYPPFSHVATWALRIQQLGGKFNGKHYKVTDACVKCNRCIKSCPAKNIKYENGKFKFGNGCLMCMRCSLNCPKDAIKIGLFDKWRVNGAYSFDESDGMLKTPDVIGTDKKHRDFCRKAYDKYFAYCEERVHSQTTIDGAAVAAAETDDVPRIG
ncbi:MAG: EFR1 family ferrodoxin [Roseburia sp.]|nr:EFR1 family ferrodoxin [Roseburia sp.]